MSSNNQPDRPAIGTRVRYRPAASGGERTAVVVGYPGEGVELHLAVLMDDEQSLDLLALSVPHGSTAELGTWNRTPDEEGWPSDDVPDMPEVATA